MRERLRAHLFALTLASLKAGCCVELYLWSLCHPHHACFTALQGTHGNPWSNQVHFNSDSFPIGVDNHASYCYVNSPHLLDDLVLSAKGSVDGWATNQGKGDIQVHHRGWQWQAAQYLHSLISLHTWDEEMPPITTTLSADCSWQEDMDGEFLWLLHFVLDQRPEDCSFQHHDKCFNLFHSSFFAQVSNIHCNIWSLWGPILWEGDSPSSSWTHAIWGRMPRSHLRNIVAEEDFIVAIGNG